MFVLECLLFSLPRYGFSRARYVYSLISGVGFFFLGAGVTDNVSWNDGSTDTSCTGEYACGECNTIDCVAVCGECDSIDCVSMYVR